MLKLIPKNFSLFFLFILTILAISWPLFRIQADLPPAEEPTTIPNPLTAETFTELIDSIAGWIVIIAIPLATLGFLWAGFLFMTAGGNEERVKKAKNTLIWVAVGLAICLIGKGLTSVIKSLLGVT